MYEHREWLKRLEEYEGFTDIEFNPQKSINCQARSVALFMTLMRRDLLEEAVRSPEDFRKILLQYHYAPKLREDGAAQHVLFTPAVQRDETKEQSKDEQNPRSA
ncbi:DarT1-associated NADAR antitoxin family protein [Bryocella elongata]|uniref:DarT1-associated NADAR antitoxin family protein n=1 Tax=Bryocella elongata TaxID=863522 RepID=UPI003898DE18